jgi:hypothetical protein
MMDGTIEHWRIEWRDTPRLACLRWDCVCSDFMYAQRGEATWVRSRDGQTIQTFPLSKLFETGFDVPEHGEREVLLPAWPRYPADANVVDDGALAEMVRSRRLQPLMVLHDYDHDGQATEFLLPVGGVGCAFHGQAAIGLSRNSPGGHLFGTAAHPEQPLVLRSQGWELLRSKGKGTYVDVPCGDRGADTELEVELRADAAGIHLFERTYACPRSPERLLSQIER